MNKNWDFDGIEWDGDGYPTDESLAALAKQPIDFISAARFIIDEFGDDQKRYYSVRVSEGNDGFRKSPTKFINSSTGGWSGCESVFGVALDRFDVSHFLQQWNAGGHYQFEIPLSILEQ